jgi:hypothetical protein
MKIISIFLLLMSCIILVSQAADETPQADAVTVRVLDTPLPAAEDKKAQFLWYNFANKPDVQKFNNYTTARWKDTFSDFSTALVEKAKSQNLDSVALRKTLDAILKHSEDKIAYLPVGAYQTTLDGSLVWIVTVKWEYPPKGENGVNRELGHIRMFAFDQKSLKQVGFRTCN